jgi:hypothetical protein
MAINVSNDAAANVILVHQYFASDGKTQLTEREVQQIIEAFNKK